MSNQERQVVKRREPRTVWMDGAILDRYAMKIGPTGIAVYLTLCLYASKCEDGRRPTQREIARCAGCSLPTVRQALSRLEQAGLISVEPHCYKLLDVAA
jgi:DNA-binding MarR family transcriptional regulator